MNIKCIRPAWEWIWVWEFYSNFIKVQQKWKKFQAFISIKLKNSLSYMEDSKVDTTTYLVYVHALKLKSTPNSTGHMIQTSKNRPCRNSLNKQTTIGPIDSVESFVCVDKLQPVFFLFVTWANEPNWTRTLSVWNNKSKQLYRIATHSRYRNSTIACDMAKRQYQSQ